MGGAGELSVPGIINLGNTCYISCIIQALASCGSVMMHLEHAMALLTAGNDHCGTSGTAAAAAPAVPLAAALLECLRALQPQLSYALLHSVSPRSLLHELLSRVPAGVLEPGEEHDAAEAVELLCDLVAEELQAEFARGTWQQLAIRASLAAVLSMPGGRATDNAQTACNGRLAPAGSQAGDGVHSSSSTYSSTPQPAVYETPPVQSHEAAAAAAAPVMAGSPTPHPDPVLMAWKQHAWLPLRGSNAHELSCVRCQHRSTVQLSPFWVLPLSIAVAPSATLLGNVPAAPDASVESSLAGFFGYEAVRGWHCTRCSLAASLGLAGASGEPPGEGGGFPPPPLPPELQRLRQMLAGGGQLVESEFYAGMLAAAGLVWRPRPCLAAKRTVAAQLPLVLCLQLRRGFWSDQGHHVKVTGPVRFPLRLPLPRHLVPLLGHGWPDGVAAVADDDDGQQQQQQQQPLYELRAVVVHLGGLAGAGHYTVFRCLHTLHGSTHGDGGGGGGGGGRGWVRASDEEVQPASLGQVLGAEASLLLYERIVPA